MKWLINVLNVDSVNQQCPSNELTLTPRQRIVINREISRLESDW